MATSLITSSIAAGPVVLTQAALLQLVLATFPLLAIGVVASFYASTQSIIGGLNRTWVLLHLASGFSFAAALFELGNLSEFIRSNSNSSTTPRVFQPLRSFVIVAALAHSLALIFLLSYLHRRLSLAFINESRIVVRTSKFLPWISTGQETRLVSITSWESFGWKGEGLKIALWGLIGVAGVVEAVWRVESIRGFGRLRPLYVASEALQLVISLAFLAKIIVSICMLDIPRRMRSFLGYGCVSFALLLGGVIVPAISLHPNLALFTETPLARLFKMIEVVSSEFVPLFGHRILAVFKHQLEARPSGPPRLPSLPPSIKGSTLSIHLPSRASLHPTPSIASPSTPFPPTSILRELSTSSPLDEVQEGTQFRRHSSSTPGWHTRNWVASNLRSAAAGGSSGGAEDRVSLTSAATPHSIVEVEGSNFEQERQDSRLRALDEGYNQMRLREAFPPLSPSPSPTPTGTTFPLELDRLGQRGEYRRPSDAGTIKTPHPLAVVQEEVESMPSVPRGGSEFPTTQDAPQGSTSATSVEDELTRVYEEMLTKFCCDSPEEPNSNFESIDGPQRALAKLMLQKMPSDRPDSAVRLSVVTQASSFVESPLTMSEFPSPPIPEYTPQPISSSLDTTSPTPSGRSSRARGGNPTDLFIVPPPRKPLAIAYESPSDHLSLDSGQGSLSAPRRHLDQEEQEGIDVTSLLLTPESAEQTIRFQSHLPPGPESPIGLSSVPLSNVKLDSTTRDPERTSYFESNSDEDNDLESEPATLAQIHRASREFLTVRKASLIRTPSPLTPSLPLPTIVEPRIMAPNEGLEIAPTSNRSRSRSPSPNRLFFNLGNSRENGPNGISTRGKRSILEAQLIAASAMKPSRVDTSPEVASFRAFEVRQSRLAGVQKAGSQGLPEGIFEKPRSAPVPVPKESSRSRV
ncbi:BQ2448_952 [Microbotryum intermedium]|uniref:BQ2448_952 protein n=1 Tax=Microbotryum intermedium TaxID=269621 RepID=A0A238F9N9_9BASI|nr:BQ2448_952 [Microbotryum intermedium]